MTDAYNAGRAAGIRECLAIAQEALTGDADGRDIHAAILALLGSAPAPAGVRVKPLVWECTDWSSGDGVRGENDCEWTAEVWPLNSYIISWFGGDKFEINTPTDTTLKATSLEAAKAAAQADYDARVMAALEPAPAGVTVDQEQAFMAAVWDALKSDANDLRKQKRILSAFRSALSEGRT